MEEIAGGTRIHYVNELDIASPLLRRFAFLIGAIVKWYRKRSVINELRRLLENEA